ncbi:hypothetical protein EJF18_30019 [Clavispora lusitaniae]|uniref:Uncharacterized protein n=1 Tax=Clavispora lusitaniae TaxID=36911 RepID=A0ACD0WIG6_CLALS|nr:hypothetical protein E0198_003665 [Clavispora lusitaniae]QFZ27065.1 hypothetical protein EJF14_30019 [Clavispora lusitaniae]QFZ33627.1 hypothetical protein EJF16_30019 [Clavispora lusitaniae]QFZ39298.1 hypothetical protein EJF15_30019 [Clavispora lusitaniae]QFZ44980.1 hypothetical protein EJF18_30019 [Clavispora lusitaniae]
MFTKSATPATPVTRPETRMSDSLTWSYEWFSFDSSTTPLQLKGWVKKASSEVTRSTPSISADALDVTDCEYHKEPIVIENAVEEQQPVDEAKNADLKSALSLDKKDDQISSLSGLGI